MGCNNVYVTLSCLILMRTKWWKRIHIKLYHTVILSMRISSGIHLKYLNITCYGEAYYDFLSDIYMLIATGV